MGVHIHCLLYLSFIVVPVVISIIIPIVSSMMVANIGPIIISIMATIIILIILIMGPVVITIGSSWRFMPRFLISFIMPPWSGSPRCLVVTPRFLSGGKGWCIIILLSLRRGNTYLSFRCYICGNEIPIS